MRNCGVVAILNYTPDSFSDGGVHYSPEKAISYAEQCFNQGAEIIDIGAESTRPRATPISPEEEYQRLLPLIEPVIRAYPGQISIDTHHFETVRKIAAEVGTFIINDVTGFNDPRMIEAAAELQLPVIVSHLGPQFGQDIQAAHLNKTKIDSAEQVAEDLINTIEQMQAMGVRKDFITLDPGIGFNKTPRLNWELVGFASHVPQYPVMIGYSRKSFLYTDPLTGAPDIEALKLRDAARKKDASSQTKLEHGLWLASEHLRLAKIAVDAGARYLRVHDVDMHVRNIC